MYWVELLGDATTSAGMTSKCKNDPFGALDHLGWHGVWWKRKQKTSKNAGK